MEDRTPAQHRCDDGVELADMLRKSGVCQVDVAELTGVSTSEVQRWYARKTPNLPHAHDLRRFPKTLARALMEWIGEPHGFAVVERIEAACAATHMEHLGRAVKEGSESIMAYTDLLAKGATPARIESAISELRDDIAQKRTMLELLERERDALAPKLRAVPQRYPVGGKAS